MSETSKNIIGRLEIIDLPDWNIQGIEAKIDTGAYSSSLHCHKVEIFKKDGKHRVRFNLLDPDHHAYNDKLFELPVHDIREVKSSNGISEERVFVKTNILMFKKKYSIELSLSDRSEMKYPLLIGRNFISRKFLVDVSKVNLSNKK
ncbi:MAG: RimK/LysX family protein [Balneolaceae bacterium]